MTLRVGMGNLVQWLRENAAADEGEFELAGETYWEDTHLQRELDKVRTDIRREAITPIESYENGVSYYYDYFWRRQNVEEAESGSTIWQVWDGNGSAISTALYTVDYNARRIRFTTSTDGQTYYLDYRSYNVNLAAAAVWEKKAASVSSRFDVSTDNHSLKRAALRAAYLENARVFRKKAGGGVKQRVRSDVHG